MNKALIAISFISILVACKTKPFVEHEIRLEQLTSDCNKIQPYFRMVSNIGGERYEFERCLDVNYKKEDVRVSRQGDTVVVLLAKPAKQKALFKVTIDIDSYPKYNFVTVDDETFAVVMAY